MLVGANDGAVEQQPFQIGVLEFPEDAFPSPLPGPPVESPPDAIPIAETFGQVPPRSPGFRDPKDCIDEQAIILGCHPRTALPSRQKSLDPIPVLIGDLVTSHDRPS